MTKRAFILGRALPALHRVSHIKGDVLGVSSRPVANELHLDLERAEEEDAFVIKYTCTLRKGLRNVWNVLQDIE